MALTRAVPEKTAALASLRSLMEVEAPAPGDRLPTERLLADMIACRRQALRTALATLELEGGVGQGTFRGRAPIGQPVRDTTLLEATTPVDLMDARCLLEPQIAAAVANRCEKDDSDHLRRRALEGRAARDRAACERADDAFHQGVAQVTRNPVLFVLLRHLSNARSRAVWQREWDRTYRRVGVDSDQHHAIVEAIVRGDGPAAYREMVQHLHSVRQAMNATPPNVSIT